MLRILTLLCLAGASLAFMVNEEMLKKYGYMKIMSSCVGEDVMMKYKMQMKAACDKCKGQDVMQTMIDIQKMLKNMKMKHSPFTRQQIQQPMYVPVPYYMPQNQLQYPVFSQFPVQQSTFRTKRSMDLSPEGIKYMKEKVMYKISNFTCVLKELNYMTADNQPNYEYFNEELNNLPIDETLREDFREAMDMCRDFAMCMPVEKAKHPIKKELGTCMAFMKCMHVKKVTVCMENDFKKYAGMMGYEGDLEEAGMIGESGQLMEEISDMMMDGGDMM